MRSEGAIHGPYAPPKSPSRARSPHSSSCGAGRFAAASAKSKSGNVSGALRRVQISSPCR